MKKRIIHIFLCLLCLFFFGLFSLAQPNQQPETNIDIFKKLAYQVVDSVLTRLTIDSTKTFVIHSQSKQHEANWLIENALVQKIFQQGGQVQISEACGEKTANHFKIEYKIDNTALKYVPGLRRKLIQRQFTMQLDIRCQKCLDGSILFLESIRNQFSDSVTVANVKSLESDVYSFANDKIEHDEGITKYIEPLIALSTTGVIVYLFYSMRSK